MPKKKRTKKHSSLRRKTRFYKEMAKGVNVYWHTEDPLGDHTVDDIFEHKMYHTNPLYEPVLKRKDPMFMNVILKQEHEWQVDIDLIFNDGNNEYHKGVVLTFKNQFSNLQERMEEEIEKLLSKANLAHYIKCKIHGRIK